MSAIELPDYAKTSVAIRVWPAQAAGDRCLWGEGMLGDEDLEGQDLLDFGHGPVQAGHDLWIVAPPIGRPLHPDQMLGPERAWVVCDRCLAHAAFVMTTAYAEANMP